MMSCLRSVRRVRRIVRRKNSHAVQWVAKGNAPGYLDSDDERELEEEMEKESRSRRDRVSWRQWRELGDFASIKSGPS